MNSKYNAHFKCEKGHKWQDVIRNITRRNYLCPYCFNKKAQGMFSLASKHPELLEEWDTKKNVGYDPYKLTSGSGVKVYWKCEKCGYEWNTSISNRTSGKGCKNCKIKRKYDSFDKEYPNLIQEWNGQKNKFGPQHYSGHSNQKVWWKCKICGHEWNTQIYARARGSGCPQCYKNKKAGRL